jgi:hypothetical protein
LSVAPLFRQGFQLANTNRACTVTNSSQLEGRLAKTSDKKYDENELSFEMKVKVSFV